LPEEIISELDAEEQLLINIYQRVNPAVVNIDVSAQAGTTLADFGSGSGFIIDDQGHIVTNNHVVQDADSIRVTFAGGSVAQAQLLGTDPYADLAVIQVDVPPNQLTMVELGNSDELQVGQRVIAIGNPFGLSGSMTVGIVSALGRTLPSALVNPDLGSFSNPEIIQTDTAINPGNSGGPLLDSHGRVIGVNTAIRSESGANTGVGFAVPVNTVKRSVQQIIASGTVSYPYLGISADPHFTMAELAEPLDLPVTEGVMITTVSSNSPASRAGLRGGDREVTMRGFSILVGGDIITAIDGTPIVEFEDLLGYLVANTRVGQEVTVTIFRDGEFFDVPVTLAERPR
jgi:2-alkenal reductase